MIAELTRAAEREAAQIGIEAGARAQAIEQAALEQARRRRESEHARLDDTHRRAVARDTAAADHANREAVLRARGQLLEDVFARARTLLAVADASRYQEGLLALVAVTLRYLEGTPSVLRCRQDVSAAVAAHCRGAPDIQVEGAADADAGLVGEGRDGRLVVDNRLPALLARRRAELSVAVVRRLEGG